MLIFSFIYKPGIHLTKDHVFDCPKKFLKTFMDSYKSLYIGISREFIIIIVIYNACYRNALLACATFIL